VLDDDDINLVVVGTRHDLHAQLAREALERNKNVFVEKPLALSDAELEDVLQAAERSAGRLMVGFNRRFSPSAQQAKDFFAKREAPLSILYRVNAGHLPKQHWVQDSIHGGGRIIGEVCHFIDLMQFLTGAPPVSVFAESVSAKSSKIIDADSVFITLRFADGSNGAIAYLSEGDKSLAKERVEIFGGGKTFVIDDFRTGKAQDKGQREQIKRICAAVLEGRPAPISIDELAATSRATFRILESLRERLRYEV
jgi:polar amino acid transport system substrate-binding protein